MKKKNNRYLTGHRFPLGGANYGGSNVPDTYGTYILPEVEVTP